MTKPITGSNRFCCRKTIAAPVAEGHDAGLIDDCLGSMVMRFFRHLKKLLKEFLEFAWHNKAWWIVPIVIVLLLLTSFIFVSSSVAPFIYTLL
jgi:hypothetical protein